MIGGTLGSNPAEPPQVCQPSPAHMPDAESSGQAFPEPPTPLSSAPTHPPIHPERLPQPDWSVSPNCKANCKHPLSSQLSTTTPAPSQDRSEGPGRLLRDLCLSSPLPSPPPRSPTPTPPLGLPGQSWVPRDWVPAAPPTLLPGLPPTLRPQGTEIALQSPPSSSPADPPLLPGSPPSPLPTLPCSPRKGGPPPCTAPQLLRPSLLPKACTPFFFPFPSMGNPSMQT